MKHTIYILAILVLFFSCSTKSNKKQNKTTEPQSQVIKADSPIKTSKTDSISTKEFGQLIIDGKIKPSDNEATFRCLDKMLSKDTVERDFYFKVYKVISTQSDGALGEILGGYVKSLFEYSPDFCLDQYKLMDSVEKKDFVEQLAVEFYASGLDYKKDINEYFESVNKRLSNRTESNLKLLDHFKLQITKLAKDMNE